jgi:aminoglycoside phosphotransferase (APT) family kinase protein
MDDVAAQMPSTIAGLGDPIGLGRTAEVFAYGDGEVVKLIRPGFPDRLGESEAEVAALVGRAAVATPAFMGTTRIEGRFGLIYERLESPSMLDRMSRRPWEIDRLARQLADLHAAMHDASGSGLPDQKASLRWAIDRAAAHLPDGARGAALARLDALPAGAAICHADMHPGNVLMSSMGAVVIDWMTACCGNPAGDVARTVLLLRDSGVPVHMSGAERTIIALLRRRLSSVYLLRYRRLRALDLRELAEWRLPILAARLAEEIETERPALQALIRRELRSAP